MDCDDQDPYPNHKLCGFLATVLTIPPPISALPFLSPCHPSSDGLFFVSPNDSVVLYPLLDAVVCPKKRAGKKGSGSVSVVNQILSLVSHKCINVIVRVLHVSVSESGDDVRVAVLVDVYLPVRLWSGWQFPKAKAIAGSLFKHLSCDWRKRSAMLEGEFCGNLDGGVKSLWNISDCHVLGCQVHCDVPDSSKKMRFDLHEVFKNLPSVTNNEHLFSSRVTPVGNACGSGLWDVTDDILMNILALIGPMDLVRVAATCHHLRSLAVRIMPCMKLKLFPHQQAAVAWMLHRESKGQVLPHPLYAAFSTEDGLSFYVNTVSGEIVYGIAPTIRDFSGGMFCDEPGLGKTITALSLILKTQGKIADPPDGAQVTWCTHNGKQKCGYYELSGSKITSDDASLRKRVMNQSARRVHISLGEFTLVDDQSYSTPKRARLVDPNEEVMGLKEPSSVKGACVLSASYSEPAARVVRRTRSLNHVKNNLLHSYGEASGFGNQRKVGKKSTRRKCGYNVPKSLSMKQEVDLSCTKAAADYLILNETWIQCDACRKWRKITETVGDSNAAWFCSMNADPSHQSCGDPEEDWGKCESITYFPGFCSKGTLGGNEQNVSFFISVLKEDYSAINSKTKKALTWLAKLSPERLALMESYGLASPAMGTNCSASGNVDTAGFQKVFQAFGLVRRVEKGVIKWYYPCTLENLEFDLAALRIALREPLDSVRLYLSGATLIIVPANLVDHWKTQILKHVKPDQLRVRILIDSRKPSAHSLAWDYDVVITTFNRLSVEWGPHKKSPLMQVHWHRVLLDEGHTLGASVNLTNKLQMAISLPASSRWLLTGTPTPNTPNSQLSHLHPLLKFLHEEAYGQDSKSWEAGILRPFEAEMEEGRLQLLQLLRRCLISARKSDLKTIPPCIKKATFLDFTKEHAKSYNELVVTVRRNILLADWNDPSHVESLLNPKQWKFRSATVRNVRLSCCVAGHIKVSDAGEDIQETMDDLVAKGLDPISQEYALIKYHLQYGGNCLKCHEWCRLPIITPCRHLLCLDCAALNSEMCCVHGCDNLYEMQQPQKLTRPENPNPKWPVPKDLIELQPSYKQDDWDPDWQSTSSSKVSYLVRRLKSLQGANLEGGCSIDDDSGARYNEDRIRSPQMNSTLQQQDSKRPEPYKTVQEKVIIFSQFLEHIHVIAQQLTFANIKFAGLYCPMPSTNKVKALATFQHDATCMVLLMDGSAALGLDLSFVTHVFLMEPIWDKSMEEQVISRAHRMGASRPIHVETFAMRGTIEEQMLKFLQDGEDCKKLLNEESVKADHDGARTHRSLHDFAETSYLKHLTSVHTGCES